MEISDLPLGTAKKMSWAVIASSQTAEDQHGYFVNTSAGAYTITLPASPTLGTLISIGDGSGNAATNNITVGRNGSLIEGASSDKVISTNGAMTTFTYSGSAVGWKEVSTVAASASTSPETNDLYCFCGLDASNRLKTTSKYDFSSWSSGSDAPVALYGQSSGSRGSYVISAGGYDGADKTYCWEHDGSTWYTRTSMPTPGRRYVVGQTMAGSFYSLFGLSGSTYLKDCDRYDGYSWTSMADGPTPGRYAPGSFVVSDLIYSCFGWTGAACKDVDYFNGSTWTSASDGPDPARYSGFGGTLDDVGYCAYGYASDYITDFDGYDGSSWTTSSAVSPARGWTQTTLVRNNLTVSGGTASSGHILDCDSYNGSSWLSRDDQPSVRRMAGCGGI